MARHMIGKQTFEIEADSERTALALQARLGDFNRRRVIPIIERILDEFAFQEGRIHLGNLDIDLGSVALDQFEDVTVDRLVRELRRAIDQRLRELETEPETGLGILTGQETSLRILDQYLLHGTVPTWILRSPGFSIQEFIQKLTEKEPNGFIEKIRELGHRPQVLERLVLQLGDPLLMTLLRLFEPGQSDLISTYLQDLIELHRVHPLLELGDRQFLRLLWFLVLSYLLFENGSQFNRKSFLKSILEGISESRGIECRTLLQALLLGVQKTEKQHSLKSSLPAVLRELVLEMTAQFDGSPGKPTTPSDFRTDQSAVSSGGSTSPDLGPDGFKADSDPLVRGLNQVEDFLSRGTVPATNRLALFGSFEECLLELTRNAPEEFAALLFRYGKDTEAVKRLVNLLGENVLRRILFVLEPANSELIENYLGHLKEVHRRKPLVSLAETPFTGLIWRLTLSYLVEEPGSQFNRRSFVKSLLGGLATSENIDYLDLLAVLAVALRELSNRQPPRASLPAIVEELVDELSDQLTEAMAFRLSDLNSSMGVTAPLKNESRYNLPSIASDDSADSVESLVELLSSPTSLDSLSVERIDVPRKRLRETARHPHFGNLIVEAIARAGIDFGMAAERLLQVFTPGELARAFSEELKTFPSRFVAMISRANVELRPAKKPHEGLYVRALLESLLEFASGNPGAHPEMGKVIRQSIRIIAVKTGVSEIRLSAEINRERRQKTGGTSGFVSESHQQTFGTGDETTRITGTGGFGPTRYEQYDTLRRYLRYGILPWDVTLKGTFTDADSLLSALSGFSRPQLESVFQAPSDRSRFRILNRACGHLSEEDFQRLLRQLLPGISKGNTAFWTSLSDAEKRASHPVTFRARLLAAALDGQEFDLDRFSENPEETPTHPEISGRPEQQDYHILKAILAERFCGKPDSIRTDSTTSEVLDALISGHPAEARQFLFGLRNRHESHAAFSGLLSTQTFSSLFQLMSPLDAVLLDWLFENLMANLQAFPGVSIERLREVFFSEIIRLSEGGRTTGRFYRQVFHKLFRPPLPEPARDAIGKVRRELLAEPGLPKSSIAFFLQAVEGLDTFPEVDQPEMPDLSPTASDSHQRWPQPTKRLQELLEQLTSHEFRQTDFGGEAGSNDWLNYEFLELVGNTGALTRGVILDFLRDSSRLERLTGQAGESVLASIVSLIEPVRYQSLLDAAELLAVAGVGLGKELGMGKFGRTEFWAFLLGFLSRQPDSGKSVEQLITAFLDYFLSFSKTMASEARLNLGKSLLDHFSNLARERGRGHLVSIIHRQRNGLLQMWSAPPPTPSSPPSPKDRLETEPTRPKPNRKKTAFETDEKSSVPQDGSPVFIDNAGLILAGPFLPHFFQSLNFLETDEKGRQRLKDRDSISRAVHLLQYLVDGRMDAPEPRLVLNKVLCGVSPSVAVDSAISATDQEIEMCETLLRSIISNWTIISNTSVAGLRETFFQREGKLEGGQENWKLRIQRKTVDVLVDQVPWSFSVIFHRWMPHPVYVTW